MDGDALPEGTNGGNRTGQSSSLTEPADLHHHRILLSRVYVGEHFHPQANGVT
jgi:hypothetical protein